MCLLLYPRYTFQHFVVGDGIGDSSPLQQEESIPVAAHNAMQFGWPRTNHPACGTTNPAPIATLRRLQATRVMFWRIDFPSTLDHATPRWGGAVVVDFCFAWHSEPAVVATSRIIKKPNFVLLRAYVPANETVVIIGHPVRWEFGTPPLLLAAPLSLVEGACPLPVLHALLETTHFTLRTARSFSIHTPPSPPSPGWFIAGGDSAGVLRRLRRLPGVGVRRQPRRPGEGKEPLQVCEGRMGQGTAAAFQSSF